MSLIESLEWRASVRVFDPSKRVSNEDLEQLLNAGNLTATSGGFQPFKMIVVSNDELKEQLVPISYNQRQVQDASHVLVFAVLDNYNEGIVDDYVTRAAEVRQKDKKELVGYADSMKAWISSMDDQAKYNWAKNQAYIALGTVMVAAADLKVDSCPMEGFDPIQYQELLGLKEMNLMPVVVLPVGYRSDEDRNSKEKKVRKTRENFIVELN